MHPSLNLVRFALVAAAAFGGGIVAQRHFQVARIHAAEHMARDLAGLNDPVPRAPDWEAWRYPGAKVHGSMEGVSLRISGQLVRPASHVAMLVTRDPLEDVARFYARKLEWESPDAVATSHAAVSSHGTVQSGANYLLDLPNAGEPGKASVFRGKCLARRSRSFDLTVILTRNEAEGLTQVALFYDPHLEGRPNGPPSLVRGTSDSSPSTTP